MATRNRDLSKHMNYFDGQFLRAQDFVDEQDHYTDRRERHNRLLHTPGVADGLIVSSVQNDPTQVSISAGTAIDPLGKEIVVLATQSAKMPGAPTTKVEIYVWYVKTESDDSQDPGVSGKTRITETPAIIVRRIEPGNADPVPPNGVLLAEVQVTAGQVNPVADNPRNEVRKQATTPVGDDLTIRSLTIKRDAVDPGQWPRLICGQAKQAALQGADLIVPDGKLGVGTTNPASPLHVADHLTVGPFPSRTESSPGRLEVSGPFAELGFIRRDLTKFPQSPAPGDRFVWYNPDGSARLFDDKSGDLVTVTGTGNVGIGTASPNHKLTVGPSDVPVSEKATAGVYSATPAYLIVRQTGPIAAETLVGAEAGTPSSKRAVARGKPALGILGTMTANDLVFITGNDPKMRIEDGTGDIRWAKSRLQTDQGGSIELGGDSSTPGTGTPYIDFHFRSDNPQDFNTRIINDADGQLTLSANVVHVTGELTAAKVTQTSDARFKTSITPLSNTLEKVQRIRGVSFDWNGLYASLGRPTGHREIGVIAQEVEAVFPELVSTSGDEGYKSLNYGRLTAVLIEAVKELKSALEVMKKRIDALEKGADNQGNFGESVVKASVSLRALAEPDVPEFLTALRQKEALPEYISEVLAQRRARGEETPSPKRTRRTKKGK